MCKSLGRNQEFRFLHSPRSRCSPRDSRGKILLCAFRRLRETLITSSLLPYRSFMTHPSSSLLSLEWEVKQSQLRHVLYHGVLYRGTV